MLAINAVKLFSEFVYFSISRIFSSYESFSSLDKSIFLPLINLLVKAKEGVAFPDNSFIFSISSLYLYFVELSKIFGSSETIFYFSFVFSLRSFPSQFNFFHNF